MRLFLLLCVFALAVGAASAGWLHADSGYVLLRWGPWVLETSVLGFLAAATVAVLLLAYGLRLLAKLLGLPARLRRRVDRHRAESAQASFDFGLRKLLEGHWRRAEIELVRRAADRPGAALNYLLAARAAQRLGARDRRDHYLALAARQSPDETLAAAMTRIELRNADGDSAGARSLLAAVLEREPAHAEALALLAEALARDGDWDALRTLLERPEAQRGIGGARREALAAQAVAGLLEAAAREARLDALKQVWERAPAVLRNDAALRRAYVDGLMRLNAQGEAAAQIAAALQTGWDAALVDRYGALDGVDAVGQLAALERWLQEYGEKAELLLAAGRACLRNKLWGKARSYLEGAARFAPSPAVELALARLCEATRLPDEAAQHYRRGLELSAR